MKRILICVLFVLSCLSSTPLAIAQEAYLEPFVDVASILKGTSYTEVPKEMVNFFYAVNEEFKATPEKGYDAWLDNVHLLSTLNSGGIWRNELHYIFNRISRSYDFPFSSLNYDAQVMLPGENEVAESEAIDIAWNKIMEEYRETPERKSEFLIDACLEKITLYNKSVWYRWEIEFYHPKMKRFDLIGIYTAWIDPQTKAVTVVNDGRYD